MEVTIRRLTDEELEQDDYVHGQAFERGDRRQIVERNDWRVRNFHRLATFGLWDAAGLQATFQVIADRVSLGPQVVVPMGYLSYIGCLPAARGRGYAGACLTYALEQMGQSRQILSTLSPFSFDFYRRFGWEWVGRTRRYRVPAHVLKAGPETAYARPATRADRPRLQAIYTQFAGRYRGMIVRDDQQWEELLEDDSTHFTYTYLYEHQGQAEGYLVCRAEDFKAEETFLREFVYLTPTAQSGLLGLLRRHAMQTKQFLWEAPEDDGLWSSGYHKELETWLVPVIQGRVVDVPEALRAWKPALGARGTLTLGIEDGCAPWNRGTWQIEFEQGDVSVRSTQQEAQVRMDIQAFSQAYFGTPTVETLRRQQRLQVEEEAGYLALCHLLAGPPMWSNG